MKRLLAYLFIVLGLGLTFNVSAETIYDIKSKNNDKIVIEAFEPTNYEQFVKNKINFEEIKLIAKDHCKTNISDWDINFKYGVKKNGKYYPEGVKSITYTFDCNKNKTQIAKAEPSQKRINDLCDESFDVSNSTPTQNKYCKYLDHTTSRFYEIYKDKTDRYEFCLFPLNNQANVFTFPVRKNDECKLQNLKKGKKISFIMYVKITEATELDKSNHTLVTFDKFLKQNNQNTKIAKAEPSQTQKVANGKNLCLIDWPSNIDYGNFQGLNIPVEEVVFIKRLKYDDGSSCHLKIFASDNEKLYKKIMWSAFQDRKLYEVDGKKMSLRWLPYRTLLKIHKDQNLKMVKFNISKPKTQIAKKEPKKTQKMAKKTTYDWVAVVKHPKLAHKFIATRLSTKKKAIDLAIKKCHIQVNKSLGKSGYNDCSLVNVYKEKNKDTAQIDLDDIAALIDKAKEKTQTVEEQVVKTSNKPSLTLAEEDKLKAHIFSCWSIPLGLPYNEDLLVRIKLKLDPDGSIRTTEIMDHARMSKPGQGFYKVLAESALRAIKNCQPLPVPIGDYERVKELQLNFDAREMLDDGFSSDTQIAKTETTVKPKKKVKVVKKEPKQEELEPKKTNQDNEAPVIEVAETITVDSQTYTLKGKVKDKSRFQLTIDGRPIKVAKNGQFKFEGFAIDSKEQLKIVATDKWRNKSEKLINIKVEFKQTADARSYEKPNPNNIRTKTDNDKIGIIIGIEKYQALSNLDAPYANRDANAFRAYATRALGIPNKNLKVLIDNEATRSGLLKSLKIWLPQMTRGKSKDIYIFFAGHGLASDDGKDLHILPQDGDPILLEDTALSRIEMFDLINKVSPKSVTMFFDTCYSGQTRDEGTLVAGLRPVRIVADEQDTPNNFTIFTASNYDQTSGSINEAEHGIFSYYLMKGLEGNADANKDKKLTNGELIAYLKSNVSQEAFSQNRSQEPMLAGDPDKVLMSYR